MRRIAIVMAVTGLFAPLLAQQAASAHTPDLIYAGYQIAYSLGTEDFPSVAGYLNVPSQPPVRVNDGALADESISTIVNRDPLPHSLALCASACDTASGVPNTDDKIFPTVNLPANGAASSADVAKVNAKLVIGRSYVLMCTVHPYMRAKLTVTG